MNLFTKQKWKKLSFSRKVYLLLLSSVQLPSCVLLFVTPLTAAYQASLSKTSCTAGRFFTTKPPEEALLLQFSSVTQSCLTLCDPMECSTPGLPVHHQLPEFTQTHLHWVGDAIQPFHPLLSPSPPAFNLSQHQGLFQWVSSLHQVAKVLEFQLQHQSFQ